MQHASGESKYNQFQTPHGDNRRGAVSGRCFTVYRLQQYREGVSNSNETAGAVGTLHCLVPDAWCRRLVRGGIGAM